MVFLGLLAVKVRADDTVYSEGYFYYTEKDESSATYGEGTVDRWTGLGYRVYRYKRANYDGIEYGPFWIGDRTATVEKK